MFKIKNHLRGFTLTELLVVISIIVMLTTMAISGYQSSRKRTRLTAAVTAVEALIKQSLNYSLTGLAQDNPGVSGSELIIPRGGYGVAFDASSAVTSAARTVTPFNDFNEDRIYSNPDEIGQHTLLLDEDIWVTKIEATPSAATDILKATILFKHPRGVTILNNNGSDSYNQLIITIGVEGATTVGDGLAGTITIDRTTGKIDVSL